MGRRWSFVWAVLILVASGAVAEHAPAGSAALCRTQSVDGVGLTVSLAKSTFVVGEPIIITTSIRNESDAPRRLAELSDNFHTVGYEIIRAPGGESIRPTYEISWAMLRADYGWVFSPHEARSCSYDLRATYSSLPAGSYAVRAIYTVDKYARDVWHGRIVSPYLEFTIGSPSDQESQYSEAFRLARPRFDPSDPAEMVKLAGKLYEMRDAKGQPLAPYAAFESAALYDLYDCRKTAISIYREAIAAHPDMPYFTEMAKRRVAVLLCNSREFESARLMCLMMHDGYERQSLLLMIQRGQNE